MFIYSIYPYVFFVKIFLILKQPQIYRRKKRTKRRKGFMCSSSVSFFREGKVFLFHRGYAASNRAKVVWAHPLTEETWQAFRIRLIATPLRQLLCLDIFARKLLHPRGKRHKKAPHKAGLVKREYYNFLSKCATCSVAVMGSGKPSLA